MNPLEVVSVLLVVALLGIPIWAFCMLLDDLDKIASQIDGRDD